METIITQAMGLADKASEGPWKSECPHSTVRVYLGPDGRVWETEYNDPEDFRDAEFIAASRTLVPAMALRLEIAIHAFTILAKNIDEPPMKKYVEDLINELEKPIDL